MALLPTTSCSHTLMFIPRFTCPCSNMHTADVRLWVCTHQAWDHIQPDTSHYHSFKTFLTFHTSILAFVCWFAHISHGLTFNLTHHTSTLSRISSNIFAVLFLMYGRCLIRLDMEAALPIQFQPPRLLSWHWCHHQHLITATSSTSCLNVGCLKGWATWLGLSHRCQVILMLWSVFFFFLFLFFRSNLLC